MKISPCFCFVLFCFVLFFMKLVHSDWRELGVLNELMVWWLS